MYVVYLASTQDHPAPETLKIYRPHEHALALAHVIAANHDLHTRGFGPEFEVQVVQKGYT